MPKAVLFDNDGTLVASEPLHWHAWGALMKELRIDYDPELIRAQVGQTAPVILGRLLDKYRPGWKPRDYNLSQLAVRKNDIYLEGLEGRLQSYPQTVECLKWLRAQGIRTGVVSNAKRREMMRAVTVTGLLPYLEVQVSRDDAPAAKPNPAPYLVAAAQLDIKPEDCLVMEDAPPGLESGLLAGMRCVGVTTNFSREILEAPVRDRPDLRPVAIVDSMAEFFEWLKR